MLGRLLQKGAAYDARVRAGALAGRVEDVAEGLCRVAVVLEHVHAGWCGGF